MSELTAQHELVLQQKYTLLQAVLQSSDTLDSKASTLLQSGGLIVALVGVVSIPGFVTNPSTAAKIGIGVAFGAFLLMVILSLRASLPSKVEMPGALNWDEIHQDYLFETLDNCYQQILSDCIQSIQLIQETNERKSTFIVWSALLLIVQIGGLFSIALLP